MTIRRRTFTEMLAGAGLALVSTGAMAQAKTVEVTMKQGAKALFVPDSVTIAAGDTVKWSNPAFVTHSVTCDPKQAVKAENVALPPGVEPFDSGAIEEDGTWSHTFTTKGTYKYFCKYHEAMGMVGTVIVT